MNSSSAKDRINISIEEQKEIKNFIKKNKIKGYVHASYMLNFCKFPVGSHRIQWAYNMLHEDVELGKKLGMEAVVIHMCSGSDIKNNTKHLEYFFENYNPTKLLLENSASNLKVGGTMVELGKVFKPLYKKYGKRIGICIDTCHAFSIGYPIHTVDGMKDLLDEYKKYIGDYSTLQLIHLNDSKEPLGSNKDRHEIIGKGYIYKEKEALLYLLSFAKEYNIPVCLETGELDMSEYDIDEIIKLLEEFREYHKSFGNIKEIQYSKAIYYIKNSNIKKIKNANELEVGKSILSKIDEYINTGKIEELEEIRTNPTIIAQINLTKVFGIGPKKATELISQGILSIEDLKKSEVRLTHSQQLGLQHYDDLLQKIPRKESEKVRQLIEDECKLNVILAGSYNAGKETSGDIDIIISVKKEYGVLRKMITQLFEKNILLDTFGVKIPTNEQKVYIGLLRSTPVRKIDIHIVNSKDLFYHMLYFGYGENFSRIMRQKAKKLGYKLNNKGLFKNGKKIKLFKEV